MHLLGIKVGVTGIGLCHVNVYDWLVGWVDRQTRPVVWYMIFTSSVITPEHVC
jgi:beta-lactamase class D